MNTDTKLPLDSMDYFKSESVEIPDRKREPSSFTIAELMRRHISYCFAKAQFVDDFDKGMTASVWKKTLTKKMDSLITHDEYAKAICIREKISEIDAYISRSEKLQGENDFDKRLNVLKDWLIKQEYSLDGGMVTIVDYSHKTIQIALNNLSTDKALFDLTLCSFQRHFWQEQKIAKLKRGR